MMDPMKKLERWNQVLLILNPFDISSGFLMERHLSLKIQVSMILVLFQREVKSWRISVNGQLLCVHGVRQVAMFNTLKHLNGSCPLWMFN